MIVRLVADAHPVGDPRRGGAGRDLLLFIAGDAIAAAIGRRGVGG